ncbi:hypothetical protein JET18_20395 [Chryseobacterium sp. L7]|uniref:DUF4303 domain-containing protein n=1 Tax=Chryseobacterium endalhagicum TaxID=2797638 RepID=A0ABS1QKY1_9FLAO|nr:hypothetical protein [Chryseobacterium endalhagicum]MBL1223216.1 hypothetical protein [Chryseobacterium endalhagicum]
MQNLKNLNIELKNYLATTTEQMVEDFVQMLKGGLLTYFKDKSAIDTGALYFEYEYDYLNITAWAADKKGEIITEPLHLPVHVKKDSWNAFLPEKIWDAAADFQENSEDDEEFDEIWDEYNDEKYKIFEDWFCECWKIASTQAEVSKDAYFSIHDSYFKTDLNTFKTINDDEIAERFKTL